MLLGRSFLTSRFRRLVDHLGSFMIVKSAISFFANALLLRVALLASPPLLMFGCHGGSGSSGQQAGTSNPAVVPETAKSAYRFVNSIGVNTHLNYFDRTYGNFPLVERELGSIGILHVRDGIHLQNADYNNILYGRWGSLGKIGVRFDAVLDPRSNLGPLTASLLNQVDVLAAQTIESFEGPNELDVSNISSWAAVDRTYQAALYSSTTSMTGGNLIKVLGPSMANASNGSQVGEISGSLDDGNLHPYPAAQMPSVVFPSQPDLAELISDDKEIVFTESGYHNALNDHSDQPAVSETAAAKYIPRLFLEDFAQGIPRTFLYELFDEAPDPGLTNFQMHWGLVRANGSEKPAFTAMKNMIGELSDTTEPVQLQQLAWSLSTPNAQTHHILLEKSTGEFDLVLWQEVTSYDAKRQADINNPAEAAVLNLGQQAKSITLYEPTDQTQPIQTFTNVTSAPLQIPDHPLVVKILLQ
jgi:hypothetical protein